MFKATLRLVRDAEKACEEWKARAPVSKTESRRERREKSFMVEIMVDILVWQFL